MPIRSASWATLSSTDCFPMRRSLRTSRTLTLSSATKQSSTLTRCASQKISNISGFSALILEAFNNTSHYNKYVHDGLWKRSATFSPFVYPLNELAGKTLGIVGLGAIGTAVAKIANAFEMKVLGFNRSEKHIDGVENVGFDELLRRSDIVTVHCPLNPDSQDMFNRDAFGKMKRGALFVNTARGGVVVEQDLFDALESGRIGRAAIDTLRVEPMEGGCLLMEAKNCIMTPHIAWAPVETRERLMKIVVDNIKNYFAGHPTNLVNRL